LAFFSSSYWEKNHSIWLDFKNQSFKFLEHFYKKKKKLNINYFLLQKAWGFLVLFKK
jgi:hypothetical protein